MTDNTIEQNYHFFVSNFFGWATAEDPMHALKELAVHTGQKALALASEHDYNTACVFRVELPLTAHYQIEQWEPYEVNYKQVGMARNLHTCGDFEADSALQVWLTDYWLQESASKQKALDQNGNCC